MSVLGIGETVQILYYIEHPSGYVNPYDIAITPDGTKALMTGFRDPGYLIVLDLTQSPITIEDTLSVGRFPRGVAITPDGSMAIVANHDDGTLSVFDLTQSPIPSGYTVPTDPITPFPTYIAITPDGTKAYVGIASADNVVDVFDLTETPIEYIDRIASISAEGIAITPDQAPISVFTASVSGMTVSCDGSGSSSPVGNIKEYQWNFGDGTPVVTTTSPTASHTYRGGGDYTISLTVVNDAGTSTEVTFTGQTISNRGLPRARSTQTATIASIASFTGKVRLDGRKQRVRLETRWSSKASDIVRYEIFSRKKKIATISAKRKKRKTIKLHPRLFPLNATRKYKLYLHDKYGIRSVNTSGVRSPIVLIEVR